jgi:ribosomal 50S subunit-recycling heat shock protein
MSEELEPIAEENSESLYDRVSFTVDKGQAPTRIDKWVQARIEGITRNKLQNGIDGGFLTVNGKVVKSNYKTRPGDEVVYLSFINPEYIKFVMDKNDDIVAFSIVMPSFSEALQKAKGKLFPFGFYHLLQARKHSKEVVFYLIGVTPEYQSKGVTAIIFDEYYKICQAKGIDTCTRTPELEENHAIHNLWKNFNTKINKRRRTYKKEL